jgi:hypothetical protein
VPAKVVTTPAGVILRIVWFALIADVARSCGVDGDPYGVVEVGRAPVPSALPKLPYIPASEVTTPRERRHRQVARRSEPDPESTGDPHRIASRQRLKGKMAVGASSHSGPTVTSTTWF